MSAPHGWTGRTLGSKPLVRIDILTRSLDQKRRVPVLDGPVIETSVIDTQLKATVLADKKISKQQRATWKVIGWLLSTRLIG